MGRTIFFISIFVYPVKVCLGYSDSKRNSVITKAAVILGRAKALVWAQFMLVRSKTAGIKPIALVTEVFDVILVGY
jgi:hypothetical protein